MFWKVVNSIRIYLHKPNCCSIVLFCNIKVYRKPTIKENYFKMCSTSIFSLLILASLFWTSKAYINNFRFKHSNVFSGNTLPFTARITGSYYLDVLGTPELSYIKTANKQDVVTATALVSATTPVVCTGDTAGIIAALDGATHKKSTERLKKLEEKVRANEDADILNLMNSWGPYVNTSDPKYRCARLDVEDAPNTPGGYTFSLQVTFDDYKPIVFVDALGVGYFTYKRSYETKHSGHASGNPIRFCGGVDYTGDLYTYEPRPKCPISTPDHAKHYGRASIIVYKPNIVSVRRNVSRCMTHVTRVHSHESFWGTKSGWRKTRTVRTPAEDCKIWSRTKSACETIKLRAFMEGDTIDNKYYSAHPNQCVFTKKYSDTNDISEYITNPDLSYDYHWMKTSSRDLRSGLLSEGFMEVSMPTATMVTPWATIPKEAKTKGEYEFNNVTLVWEPFQPDDLCLYVPRFRGEVSYIKYKHGDYNVPLDPDNDEEAYTLFLIADQYGALFNVESTQKIIDSSKLNCMPHKTDHRTTLYQTGGDQLILVTVVDEGQTNKHFESHIPEEMRHVGTDEQAHGAFASIHYDAKKKQIQRVEHDNIATAQATRPGDPSIIHDLKHHFNSVKKSNKEGFREVPLVPPQQPSSTDVFNYVTYQTAEIQRHNLHARAIQKCFINQLDWDIYTQLLDLNPSRAISNRLNMAVQASVGGNGLYNVKKCELATNVVIIPTLRTISDEQVTVNGKTTTVKEIVKHLGVKPDPEKCFVMPLLVFTSSITGIQAVGQLTLEGIINVDKMSYVEACGRNKAYVFVINDYGHFFYDYHKNFTETARNIRNATERFLESANENIHVTGLSPSDVMIKKHREHMLSKIHTLSIVQPANIRENEYRNYPTGLFTNNLYNVAEQQSLSLGLTKIMEEQNYDRFAMREFTKEWADDIDNPDSGIFAGAGEFLDGVGDFFLKAGEGGGELLSGIGGGIGKALHGAGEGVGAAGKGVFGGIGDALKGSFMTLALPLMAVAVLGVVGVVIYKTVTGKGSPPDENIATPSTFHESPPAYESPPVKRRAGFSFGQ